MYYISKLIHPWLAIYFHFLAVRNNVAMSIIRLCVVNVFVNIGWVTRSGIADPFTVLSGILFSFQSADLVIKLIWE